MLQLQARIVAGGFHISTRLATALVFLLIGSTVVGTLFATGNLSFNATQTANPSSAETTAPWLIKPTPNAYGQVIESAATRRLAPFPVSPTPLAYKRDNTPLLSLPSILWEEDITQLGEAKIIQLLAEQNYLLIVQPNGTLSVLIPPNETRRLLPPSVLYDAVNEWNKQPDKEKRQLEIPVFLEGLLLAKR